MNKNTKENKNGLNRIEFITCTIESVHTFPNRVLCYDIVAGHKAIIHKCDVPKRIVVRNQTWIDIFYQNIYAHFPFVIHHSSFQRLTQYILLAIAFRSNRLLDHVHVISLLWFPLFSYLCFGLLTHVAIESGWFSVRITQSHWRDQCTVKSFGSNLFLESSKLMHRMNSDSRRKMKSNIHLPSIIIYRF